MDRRELDWGTFELFVRLTNKPSFSWARTGTTTDSIYTDFVCFFVTNNNEDLIMTYSFARAGKQARLRTANRILTELSESYFPRCWRQLNRFLIQGDHGAKH